MMTGDNDDARNRDEDDSHGSLSSPHLRGLARRRSSGHGQDIDT